MACKVRDIKELSLGHSCPDVLVIFTAPSLLAGACLWDSKCENHERFLSNRALALLEWSQLLHRKRRGEAWTEDGHRSSRTCLEQLASCLRSFPSISPKARYLSVLGERLGSEMRHGLGQTCRIANPLRQGEESNDSLPLPQFLHFSPYSVLYVKRGCYFPCIFYIM